MAKNPCTYRIVGTEQFISADELKKHLYDGLADKAVVEDGVKIPGFKADKKLAKSYEVNPQVVTDREAKRNNVASLQQRFNALSTSKQRGSEGSNIRQQIVGIASDLGYTVKEDGGKMIVSTPAGKKVTKVAQKEEISPVTEDELNFAKQSIDSRVLFWDGDPLSPRVELEGITWGEIRKGEQDLREGKNDTQPAKKLVKALNARKDTGSFTFIQGRGGITNKFDIPFGEAMAEDMITPIDSETQKIIDQQEDQLASEYDEFILSLNEETQKQILDEYEGSTGTLESDEQIGESEENVSDETETVEEPEGEIIETILPPTQTVKQPRYMRKIDGVWMLKKGDEYVSVDESIEKQAQVQYESDETAKSEKESRSEKRYAQMLVDGLESLKIGKDVTVSTIIPPFIWNSMITAVQKSILAGDTVVVAIEKATKSVLNKAVKEGKITQEDLDSSVTEIKSILEKIVESNDMKPKARRIARMDVAKKIQEVSGTLKRTGMTQKDSQLVRDLIVDYAKANIPKEAYDQNKTSIESLMNSIAKGSTDNDVQNAWAKVDKIVSKFSEKKRQEVIDEIRSKAKNKNILLKKVGNKKKGKVTPEAQYVYKSYIESIPFESLESLSKHELDEINFTIDQIIEGGRVDQKAVDNAKDLDRRRVEGLVFESLAKAEKKNGVPLKGEEAIRSFIQKGNKVVIINGMSVKSESGLTALENNAGVDLDNVDATGYDSEMMDVTRINQELKKGFRAWRKRNLRPIKSLETLGIELFKNTTKELKEHVENKIYKPIEKALILKGEDIREKMNELSEAKRRIIGKPSKSRRLLNSSPDVKLHNNLDYVTNGHAVSWYSTLLQNPEEYSARLSKAGVDVDALVKYMNDPKNESLKNYSEFLVNDFFPSMKEEYQDTYISVTNQPFSEGLFYPTSAEGTGKSLLDVDNMFEDGGKALLDATSGHLKERISKTSAINTAKTVDEVVLEYIESMEHSKHFIPIVQEVNKVFSQTSQPQIYKKLGQRDYRETLDYLKEILTNEDPFRGSDNAKKFVNLFTSWAALTTLSFKLAQIPKQAISMLSLPGQAWKYNLTPVDWAKGLFPYAKSDERKALSKMLGSSFIHERYFGGATDVEQKRIQEDRRKSSGRKVRGVLRKAKGVAVTTGMSPVLMGDFISLMIGGAPMFVALYRQAKANGMNEEEAYNEALVKFANDVDKTLQTSRKDVTVSQQKSPLGRMILMYKSSQTLAGLKVINAFKRFSSGKVLSKEEKIQSFYDIIYFTLSNAIFTAISSKVIADMFDGEDDDMTEEERKKAWYEFGMDAAQANLQGFGISGSLADWSLNNLRGKEHFNSVPTIKYMTEKVPELFSTGARLLHGTAKGDLTGSWDQLSESEKTEFKRVVGAKNIDDAIQDWTDWANGDKNFRDALMNYNEYKQNSTDHLWEMLWGDEVPGSVHFNESGSRPSSSRRSTRTSNRRSMRVSSRD